MGSPISQVASSTQPQGKGFASPAQQGMPPQGQSDGISRPIGKGGQMTFPGQGGQPQYGQPNRYSNTVGPWDNASIGGNSFSPNESFAPIKQQSSGKFGGKFGR